jgi:hypothetical protein
MIAAAAAVVIIAGTVVFGDTDECAENVKVTICT